jgi:hypothetical protein
MGIDRKVLEAQCDVLRESRELHQLTLQEAVDLEARLLAAEQAAHEEILAARKLQADQRRCIRDCTADLAEIDEVLRLVPVPRLASS